MVVTTPPSPEPPCAPDDSLPDPHLRPVLTDWLARAVRLPARRRTCTPGAVWQVILFAAAAGVTARADTRVDAGAARPNPQPHATDIGPCNAAGMCEKTYRLRPF